MSSSEDRVNRSGYVLTIIGKTHKLKKKMMNEVHQMILIDQERNNKCETLIIIKRKHYLEYQVPIMF